MTDFLNIGMAWIAVLLTIVLAIIYSTRKQIEKSKNKGFWISLNKKLRYYHKELGLLLIAVGFVHGLFSSDKILSFNLGTIAWVLSILLGLNWLFRVQLTKFKPWIVIHRWLSVAFIGVVVWHVVDVGSLLIENITGGSTGDTATIENLDIDETILAAGFEGNTYTDGTYTGSATGFKENLTVQVIVEDNIVTSIQVLSHNEERSQYYLPAFNTVPNEIIESQSLDVDTVAGSTFSSVGVINAVRDALSQAIIDGDLGTETELPEHGEGGGRKRH